MKWIAASGSSRRTNWTSGAEAQSKCRSPPSPHRAQHGGFGVAFDGVQHVAGKTGAEVRGRGDDGAGTQAMHRRVRAYDADQVGYGWQQCGRAGSRLQAEQVHREILALREVVGRLCGPGDGPGL